MGAIWGLILGLVLTVSANAASKKNPDELTLDEWDQIEETAPSRAKPSSRSKTQKRTQQRRSQTGDDLQMSDVVVDDDGGEGEDNNQRGRRSGKGKGRFSSTEIFLGAGITTGGWSANRTNTTVIMGGIGQLLIPHPFYVNLNLLSFVTPATPRNFMLSANIGGGFMASRTRSAPFIGFHGGAARLVVSGRGRGFGAVLGPEIGFFPIYIKGKPVSVRAHYSWVTDRINDTQPRWVSLLLGVAL